MSSDFTKAARRKLLHHLHRSALERAESERAAFLQEACAGDEALRREVELLLAQGNQLVERQLGSYRILSVLGVGGMGEVYRARDLKLDRDVALKVLPSAFAHDPERLSRFRREARVLASLNHPHIAVIHGLEESEGQSYLIMELVPGPTLADRVAAGPMPVQEALRLCRQVAEALEFAHEKGVIHRDLKPANVKLTPEGRAKVLDFGLAKAFAGEEPGADLSSMPTATAIGTEDGRILGTPAYMSPEQARGKQVDKRTDIWAFGCLLYELLSGKPAFQAETISDTIVRVLEREPDWQALPPATPASILLLLRKCLQKEPQRRLRDVGDARMEVEDAANAAASPIASGPIIAALPLAAPRSRKALVWSTSIFVLLAIGAMAVWLLKPTPSLPVVRLNMNVSPAEQLTGLT